MDSEPYVSHPELRPVFDAVRRYVNSERDEPMLLWEMHERFERIVVASEVYPTRVLIEAARLAEANGQCDVEDVLHFAKLIWPVG